MEIELRLRLKSRDFYEKLHKFVGEQLITNPQHSPKAGYGRRNAVSFEVPLMSQQDERELGRLVANDLPHSNNTHLHVTISDANAEAWWKRLFAEMSQQGWTDWMPPAIVAPSGSDDLMSHFIYAISHTCQNQGWEMKYLQPISDDRTFCQVEAALPSPDRKYKALVRVTFNAQIPEKPLIEGMSSQWSQENLTTQQFVDSLHTEILEAVKRWRERYPTQQIENTILAYLNSEHFQNEYALAYGKWVSAAKLLSSGDWEEQLTTIGFLLREAMQEYATVLVDKRMPADVETDKSKTVNRLRSVLKLHEDKLGEKVTDFLEALLEYWRAVDGLVQRQVHGAQKEAGALAWEDARRIVFQTAVVMFEIDNALQTR